MRVVITLKDELINTFRLAQEDMQAAERLHNKKIEDKIEKYKRLKETIKNTTLNIEENNIRVMENTNMKYLLEQLLPQFIETEIEYDEADMNIDEILDYWIAHIMEVPALI